MAYQDTITHSIRDAGNGTLEFLTRLASAVGTALVNIAETNHRVKQVEALQSKSDAQLAKMGLKRENIVRHVFRDVFYT